MTTAGNSIVGNLWPGQGDDRSSRASLDGLSRARPRSTGDVSISSANSGNSSYYPPGFGDGTQAMRGVPPVLRAEQGSRSRSRRGGSPFVRAAHAPGELPRRERSSRHTESDSRLVRGSAAAAAEEDPPWAKEGEDMFGVFLDRFSRPISQASVRTTSNATMQALGPRANTHDATATMATSLAAAKKSRASTASFASRTSSSASLSNLSQYLGAQRSLPNLPTTADTLGSTKDIMSMTDATATTHDDGDGTNSDDDDQTEDGRTAWDWEKASPIALRKKVVELERFQKKQDLEMEQVRRDIQHEKRYAL